MLRNKDDAIRRRESGVEAPTHGQEMNNVLQLYTSLIDSGTQPSASVCHSFSFFDPFHSSFFLFALVCVYVMLHTM